VRGCMSDAMPRPSLAWMRSEVEIGEMLLGGRRWKSWGGGREWRQGSRLSNTARRTWQVRWSTGAGRLGQERPVSGSCPFLVQTLSGLVSRRRSQLLCLAYPRNRRQVRGARTHTLGTLVVLCTQIRRTQYSTKHMTVPLAGTRSCSTQEGLAGLLSPVRDAAMAIRALLPYDPGSISLEKAT